MTMHPSVKSNSDHVIYIPPSRVCSPLSHHEIPPASNSCSNRFLPYAHTKGHFSPPRATSLAVLPFSLPPVTASCHPLPPQILPSHCPPPGKSQCAPVKVAFTKLLVLVVGPQGGLGRYTCPLIPGLVLLKKIHPSEHRLSLPGDKSIYMQFLLSG